MDFSKSAGGRMLVEFVPAAFGQRDMLSHLRKLTGMGLSREPLSASAPFPVKLCCLAGPDPYQDKEWLRLHHELQEYSIDHHVFLPHIARKGWEWTQIAYGLSRLQMIRPDSMGLGVGAGHECVIFWLGDRIRRVVATDLYGNCTWTQAGGKEADASILSSPQTYCPKTIDLSRVQFMNVDGTSLSFADNSFDFAWSTSSIEHFGGHRMAAQAVREMARVVRPGGVLAIATEYLLDEQYSHPENFTKPEIEQHLVGASPLLRLTEPIDYTLPPMEYLYDSIILPQGVHRRRRHIVLNDGEVQWTSIMLFFQKIA